MRVSAIRLSRLLCLVFLSSLSLGQARILITSPVDESQLTVLKGNTHPLARSEFDLGAAPGSLPMNRMLLVLKRSEEQESALRRLIDEQQDKASPSYHKWLTPEDFGKQFGPSDQDVQQVTGWLQRHGFQAVHVSTGKTSIEFSGAAAQVQEALHTSIHKYAVNSEEHWANVSDPQIPTALSPVVAGVESLNDFQRRPMYHLAGVFSRSKSTGQMKPLQPLSTFPGGNGGCAIESLNCYGIGPYDFATIYNVASLWTGSPVIDGTGETIAIVGETDIDPQDVADFRNLFDLPALTPTQLNIIHNGPAPGILTNGEETESDLDVEWSSAIAKGATIDFVVSQSTETTAGVDLSAEYIIDNNLAPILSESYGLCELGLGNAGNLFYSQLWQQAAAEGITVFIAAGDSGSAGCDIHDAAAPSPAHFGLEVSGFASTPYNVAVGGTDFNDLGKYSQYWASSNNSATQASALSYIPETTWNDSCTNAVFGNLLGYSANAEINCNDTRLRDAVITVAGSGGRSNCITSDNSGDVGSCSAGYAKPSWQTGTGVPQDGVRDIPDVSLFAASGSPSGSFYIICEADQTGGNSCNSSAPFADILGIGGTSASAPSFAGIMALVNQHTNSRQGNANYVFYKLATNQPGVFNDVPAGGTIAMPCETNSPNCTTSFSGDQYGILTGYAAGAGYDLATGLGSVNVANLVSKWNTVSFSPSTATLVSLTPATITHGQAVNVTVEVTGGSGTATGTVALLGGASGTQFIDSHVLDGTGTATWTSNLLPGGSYSVHAHYAGDGNYGSSDSTASAVVVNKENSSAQVNLVTFDPTTGQVINANATTAVYGSSYLLRVNVLNSAGAACSNFQTGCPSGSVALTDNGSPLDGGTFTLNSLGYFEDQRIQLSGGAHSLQAVYAGDNSFKPSAPVIDVLTITPAPTTITATANASSTIGSSVVVLAQIATKLPANSSNSETGTVTFTDATSNTVLGTGYVSDGCDGVSVGFCLQAFLQVSAIQLAAGSNSIVVTYGGDSDLLASGPSAPVTVTCIAGCSNPSGQSLGLAFFQSTGGISSASGGTITTPVEVTASNGFAGAVKLTCSVAGKNATDKNVPTCSFSPAQVNITSSNSVSTTMTIISSTTSANMMARPQSEAGLGGIAITGLLLMALPLGRVRKLCGWIGLAVVLSVGMTACGGGSGSSSGVTTGGSAGGSGPTPDVYTVTFRAADAATGTVTAQDYFNFTVN